ncbi:MAG: hypothetical protein EA384_12200 [Spirochaetaceae bacterium]|nr:MAG: hypothetical protein EA384_12200 [Spirochaetaceae bacterium]
MRRPGCRAAVAAAALAMLLGACRTAPPVFERDLVAYLPADQGAYLFINDALTGEIVLEALLPAGVSAEQLAQVVDRTDLVVASVARMPQPALNLVAAGRYPRRIIENNLRRDPDWSESVLQRSSPARSYFTEQSSGFSVAVLRSGYVLVSEGQIEQRLEQASMVEAGVIPAVGASLETQLVALESEAIRHQLTVHFPEPGREAMSRFGAPIRMPLQDITVFFDRGTVPSNGPADTGHQSDAPISMAGIVRLESEQDARAFHVLFRLLLLAVGRDAGLDMQLFLEQLETQRTANLVRFHGASLQSDELRRLMRSFSARFGVQ